MPGGSVFLLQFQVDQTLVTKRGYRKILRDINREGGQRHKHQFLRKHFENRPETYPGAGGYGYRRRTAKWNKHKLRKVGHVTPNVYTGELKKRVLTATKVTATRKHWQNYVKVGFRMPAWQKKELEIISRREQRENVRWMKKRYYEKANSRRYVRYRRQRLRR